MVSMLSSGLSCFGSGGNSSFLSELSSQNVSSVKLNFPLSNDLEMAR